jgi:hypothetical protein
MRVRSHAFLLVGLGFLAGAGCKKNSESAGTDAAMAPAEVKISDVQLGRRIGANSRIADATEGAAPSATVTARWTFQDGQVVKEDSRTIAPGGTEATEFHISKPSGWPKGKYKVDIGVGNASHQTKDFEVK